MGNNDELHTLFIRVPIPLYDKILIFTRERGMSVTEFVKRACAEKIDSETKATNAQSSETPISRADVRDMIREEVAKYYVESHCAESQKINIKRRV